MDGLSFDFTLNFPGLALAMAADLPCHGLTAVFGPSGSGKSTLLRVIAGLETAAAGEVCFRGQRWLARDTRRTPAWQRDVGYVFQDARLFPHLSVRGNLDYAVRRARHPVNDSYVIDSLDLGPLLTRRPISLSGGERQRVAIGRALLSGPAILLMDEPLAALDEIRKGEILPYIEQLRDEGSVPILYVSHSLAEVTRLADHIVLVRDGEIVRSGALQSVMADPASSAIFGVHEAGAVLTARIEDIAADGLAELSAGTGRIWLPASGDMRRGATLRLRIRAQDVMLALTRPENISALNVLAGRVISVTEEGPGNVTLVLDTGGQTLLARITRRSWLALELRPGTDCFAVIKSVAIARPGD